MKKRIININKTALKTFFIFTLILVGMTGFMLRNIPDLSDYRPASIVSIAEPADIESDTEYTWDSHIKSATSLVKTTEFLTWYNNQISELLEKNTDLQKQIDNKPAPAPVVVTQSDGVSDTLRQMDEDELRQKASDYLDKVNRQLDDEHLSKYMKLHDYTK